MDHSEAGVIAHQLGKKLIIVQPVKKRNGESHFFISSFVPREGAIAQSYQHNLHWHDDF